jgi:hypothetical protein
MEADSGFLTGAIHAFECVLYAIVDCMATIHSKQWIQVSNLSSIGRKWTKISDAPVEVAHIFKTTTELS